MSKHEMKIGIIRRSPPGAALAYCRFKNARNHGGTLIITFVPKYGEDTAQQIVRPGSIRIN